jgi:hypothetical protein
MVVIKDSSLIFRNNLKLRKEGTKKTIKRDWQKLKKGKCQMLRLAATMYLAKSL